MQSLEWYDLGNGELIVNVTEIREISEVRLKLSRHWTWDSTETRIIPGEEGEGATEWLTLLSAKRKVLEQAA